MDKPELALNYLKVLIWPLLTIVILLSFHSEIGNLLGGDVEVEVFGVKLKGKKISGLDELEKQADQLNDALSAAATKLNEQDATNLKLREENDALRKMMEEQNKRIGHAVSPENPPTVKKLPPVAQVSKELAQKSRSLSTAIQADIDRAQSIVQGKNVDQAREYESRGFEYLLTDQFEDAIRSFEAAYAAYPSYHNVDEIRRLLKRYKNELEDPSTRDQSKKEIYGLILSKYKWGMPESAETELRKFLGS